MELNGIHYERPGKPLAVVCIDGGDPEYFQSGLRDQIIPNITRFMEEVFTKWQRDRCRVLPAPITCRS